MDENSQALIPIINSEPRVYQLLAYTEQPRGGPVGALEVDRIMLAPGLTYVTEDRLQRAKIRFDDGGYVIGYQHALRLEDPTRVPDYAAVKLARTTASRPALRLWLNVETRPRIRAVLETQLGPDGVAAPESAPDLFADDRELADAGQDSEALSP